MLQFLLLTMSLGSGGTAEYFNGSIAGIYVFSSAFSNAQHDQFVGLLSIMFSF